MPDPLIIDSFAGGGGASTGIEAALGRSPDVAINHSADALRLHAANHPDTLHLTSDIWAVDPLTVYPGRHIGLLWASPDCKHFSKAKGAAPRDRNIRDLAWIIVKWARFRKPDVIIMENVEEFTTWGPTDNDGIPVAELAGTIFTDWKQQLRQAGYKLSHRELRACDYGAPTIRKRFFLIARRDGRPITWPKPTHGDPASPAVRRGKLLPWRTAAEIIDWSLPCPSIFATAPEIMARHGVRAVRPLKPATLARIARGIARYVLQAERPFLIHVAHGDSGGRREYPLDDPLGTVTGAGVQHGLVTPILSHLYTGNADGGHGEVERPLKTVTAGGQHHALVAPVLTYAQQGGAVRDPAAPIHTITASRKDQNALIGATLVQTGYGEAPGQAPRALDPDAPLGTIVAGGGKHAAAAAFLAQHNTGVTGHDAREPLSTVAATGSHQTPVAAFFAKYYGTGDGARMDEPSHTVTVRDRLAHVQAALSVPPFGPEHHARARQVADFLRAHGAWNGGEYVTVTIAGADFVITDIGMRMLTPRELFRAQGFPDDYRIDGTMEDGRWVPVTKSVQVSCCGNSVCPPIAEALVRANCGHLAAQAGRAAG